MEIFFLGGGRGAGNIVPVMKLDIRHRDWEDLVGGRAGLGNGEDIYEITDSVFYEVLEL